MHQSRIHQRSAQFLINSRVLEYVVEDDAKGNGRGVRPADQL